jgi:tetratricopeptide (TPR) repeat protein
MKNLFACITILLCSSFAFSQQSSKIDNALLLDYYQNQRFLDASDYLKKTFPEPVTDGKVLAQMAYASQMANRLVDAEGYYQRLYDMDTTSKSSLYSMASINLRRGNMVKAEFYYKKIIQKDSTNYLAYKQLASIASGKNNITAAIVYLQKANRLNSYDADVAADLSDYYINLQQFDLALRVLNKSAENDPEDVVILTSLMKLNAKQKKWPETITVCLKLINLGSDGGDVLTKLGIAYYGMKNYSCGAETMAEITDIEQTESSCYYLSMCYKGLKDNKNAIVWMSKAIDQGISPNISSYYGEIADTHEHMAVYKKAITDYQKGLQFKEDPSIYSALASLYDVQLKDKAMAKLYYKKAADAYKQSLQSSNDNPMNYYTLANIYDVRLKDTANAIKYYKRYLDAKPAEKQQAYITYTQSRIGQLQVKN